MASQYDGGYKYRTKSCDECLFYLQAGYTGQFGRKRKTDVCNWGVAFKRLTPIPNPIKCQLINRPSPNRDRTRGGVLETLVAISGRDLKREAIGEKCR